ncbi:MAG TPA: Gfo/Idh/MocA family oxidoreductase [bacterium]|nr:Gfo/Idh/MocA family oxidoreductase [bacterium]
MAKVGWGVIGAGGIADRRTIPEGILPAKNAKLVAVMDADPETAQTLSSKYQVPSYIRAADLLANEQVEAVYVASPTYCHKPQTIEAARAGKHVLCEKPLGLTIREAEAMLDECRKAKVNLGVGFMMRYNVYHQKIRSLIEKGSIGTVVFARAQLTCWYPPIEGAWRQDPKLGGGGALMDLTVHCVDLLEFLLGPVAEVGSLVERRVHAYPVDDTNAVMIRFASGAVGFVDCAFNIPDDASENVLEIQGSKGCIKGKMTIGQGPGGEVVQCLLKNAGGYSASQKREPVTYQPLALSVKNTYQSEIEAFSDSVLKAVPPPISGDDGLHNMKVVEAVKKSAKTGRFQKV